MISISRLISKQESQDKSYKHNCYYIAQSTQEKIKNLLVAKDFKVSCISGKGIL